MKLGEIAVLINGDRGKNYPSQADIVPVGEVPFVNAGHLNGRSICFTNMNYIPEIPHFWTHLSVIFPVFSLYFSYL